MGSMLESTLNILDEFMFHCAPWCSNASTTFLTARPFESLATNYLVYEKHNLFPMITMPLKYWININPWIRVKCNKPAEINTITFTNKLISNWKILSNWKKSHIFFVGANLLISTTKGIMKATLLNRISIVSRLQHCISQRTWASIH